MSIFVFCYGYKQTDFTHILQDYFTGTGAILCEIQQSNYDSYGSINHVNPPGSCNTNTTKQSTIKQSTTKSCLYFIGHAVSCQYTAIKYIIGLWVNASHTSIMSWSHAQTKTNHNKTAYFMGYTVWLTTWTHKVVRGFTRFLVNVISTKCIIIHHTPLNFSCSLINLIFNYNDYHVLDNILKCIFSNEKNDIFIHISHKFVFDNPIDYYSTGT